MVFHWRLSDSRSNQVSRTLLAVLNNAVVWMVSTRPPTSKSSSLFSNPLVTVPKAPITIGIIVTFMFRSFFNSLARSRCLFFFSHSFSFILRSAGTAKPTILQILFFYWFILDLVVWPRFGDPFVSQNPRGFCASHFLGQMLGCALLLLLLFNFLSYFRFLSVLHWVITQDIAWGRLVITCILFIYIVAASFGWYF